MDENDDPIADVVDNVRSAARGALAPHIDGSSKDLNKRGRGPRMSDAAKIESLYASADCLEAFLFALVDDVRHHAGSKTRVFIYLAHLTGRHKCIDGESRHPLQRSKHHGTS